MDTLRLDCRHVAGVYRRLVGGVASQGRNSGQWLPDCSGGLFATQPHDRAHSGEGRGCAVPWACPGSSRSGSNDARRHLTTIGVGTRERDGRHRSFMLSGLACVFVSLCYAELASMVPIAGSAYTYAYATLGEVVAWIIGWD